jgi:hypothetical protein
MLNKYNYVIECYLSNKKCIQNGKNKGIEIYQIGELIRDFLPVLVE